MMTDTEVAWFERNEAALNEMDRDEWRDLCRTLRPNLSDADFDEMWIQFAEFKSRKYLQ